MVINTDMEENTSIDTEKKTKRGGKRAGSGRKPGSKNLLSIEALLNQVSKQSNGKDYVELLVQDFIEARSSHNRDLLLKYHNLILNKVMNNLNKIEVNDTTDSVEAKKLAFAEALAKMMNTSKD